jgi:methyl-accepting chemotaxis protein
VNSAADGTAKADEVVSEARQGAEASGQIVLKAVGAMNEIEESSKEISQIIGVIDDIAFQTNLLALNAGVEAARAGEAGRGFAVVAAEVRSLAQRSSEAAREVTTLVETAEKNVERGVGLARASGTALSAVVKGVTGVAEQVTGIAGSMEIAETGIADVTQTIRQLDGATQKNAAMFEETTAAIQSFRDEASKLARAVESFVLAPDETAGGTAAPAPRRGPDTASVDSDGIRAVA